MPFLESKHVLVVHHRHFLDKIKSCILDFVRHRSLAGTNMFPRPVAADAFDAKVTEIRQRQDGKVWAIGQMQDAERQNFYAAAFPVIEEVVRGRGAVAVLDSRAIFLAAEAIYITDPNGATEPVRDLALGLLERLAVTGRELGVRGYLDDAAALIEEPCYQRQRELYQAKKSLQAVTAELVVELAQEVAS